MSIYQINSRSTSFVIHSFMIISWKGIPNRKLAGKSPKMTKISAKKKNQQKNIFHQFFLFSLKNSLVQHQLFTMSICVEEILQISQYVWCTFARKHRNKIKWDEMIHMDGYLLIIFVCTSYIYIWKVSYKIILRIIGKTLKLKNPYSMIIVYWFSYFFYIRI